MNYDTIRSRIRAKMLSQGLTVSKLARKIDVSHTTVNRHLASSKISLDYLSKYSNALDCTENWLRYGIERTEIFDEKKLEKAVSFIKKTSIDSHSLELTIKALVNINTNFPTKLDEKELVTFCISLYYELSQLERKKQKEKQYNKRLTNQLECIVNSVQKDIKEIKEW
ncbi:helix-turn-helix domain-containing protein [Piscirickettsia salmonis]|nr:helix-turn-helix transcriptional regulator [Piscirickettsia salmonis]PEQ15206.1 XRE family transcriptional regulator [Piscirickettsia salmonis]QHS34158.1 helix-turn-helix transcriptional regulator [Piscirickettsia salmonis]QHS34344.1 helix-turn-helix transcriptional regulator [Piscirickettsia salmonis]QIX57356.1 helix-turn-helix transcriptional regulator [Piscirickettsia salmonis]QNR82654.1 helix-turn-helix transcriptional regulator [Piscirickettsia salmonis]